MIIKSTKPFRVPLSEPATVGTRVKNMMGSTGVVTLYVPLFTVECDEIIMYQCVGVRLTAGCACEVTGGTEN